MNGTPAAATPRMQAGVAASREAVGRSEPVEDASLRLKARLAGALWLMVVATGTFAFIAVSRVMVSGDASATAANIRESETLFRLGFTANLVAGVFYLGVTVLLYALLKPVGRSVSRLAASFGLAGVAAGAATGLLQLAPMVLLGDAPYMAAFTGAQQEALALTFLRLAVQGSGIAMLFFGLQCILLGYLIARSAFLPRILGVLLGVGGASYVISSVAGFVAPAFGAQLSPFIVPAALVGEGSLSIWLVAKGVDVARWQERAVRQ